MYPYLVYNCAYGQSVYNIIIIIMSGIYAKVNTRRETRKMDVATVVQRGRLSSFTATRISFEEVIAKGLINHITKAVYIIMGKEKKIVSNKRV